MEITESVLESLMKQDTFKPAIYDSYCYSTKLFQPSADSVIRNRDMRKQLIEFSLFVTETLIDALKKFFIEKNYSYFDPHVGDTACQIRACMYLVLSERTFSSHLIDQRIRYLKKKCVDLVNYMKNYQNQESIEKNNALTVKDYLVKIGGFFPLSNIEKILFISYFLTKFKQNSVRIDYESISKKLNVSSKFSRKIVHLYQVELANDSCLFIQNLSGYLNVDYYFSHLRYDDVSRPVLPCYPVMKLIWKYLLLQKQTILIKVCFPYDQDKELILQLTPSLGKKTNVEKVSHSLKPMLIISGITGLNYTKFIQYIENHDMEKIIFSNFAAHPQYSGNTLLPFYNEPYKDTLLDMKLLDGLQKEIEKMRDLADIWGCSQHNPNLFLAKHVYFEQYSSKLSMFNIYSNYVNALDLV